jgi:hypothetical protein
MCGARAAIEVSSATTASNAYLSRIACPSGAAAFSTIRVAEQVIRPGSASENAAAQRLTAGARVTRPRILPAASDSSSRSPGTRERWSGQLRNGQSSKSLIRDTACRAAAKVLVTGNVAASHRTRRHKETFDPGAHHGDAPANSR